ncbi:MAG: phosphoribosylaminoimidazolesuccinocarboxamide synthase, partial [Proteobacteria bacterium]|nr:phosphoribosylaminoimidazolesuccinocarboxamide synthase [Pseudomonadota bacterium]
FEAGERPDSFDKDFVRSWVAERCDPYKDAIPAIPADLILGTTNTYAEAFETITGRAFEPDLAGATVLERIRERLAPLFGAA